MLFRILYSFVLYPKRSPKANSSHHTRRECGPRCYTADTKTVLGSLSAERQLIVEATVAPTTQGQVLGTMGGLPLTGTSIGELFLKYLRRVTLRLLI